MKKAEKSAKRAKLSESAAAASAAESSALFSGAGSPRLSKKGRAQAAALSAQSAGKHATEVRRLKRHVVSEVAGREKTMKLAKAAADKAEKLKGQRDTARRERRLSEKKLAKSRAATAKLKNGGRFLEKRPTH